MAQNVPTEPAGDKPEDSGRVEDNGTNRSNVMPISAEAARQLDDYGRRQRADDDDDHDQLDERETRLVAGLYGIASLHLLPRLARVERHGR